MLAAFVAEALAQAAGAGAPVVQLNLGNLVIAAVGSVLALLGSALIWFVKRLIASLDGFKLEVRRDLGQVKGQMQQVTQELFGPFGTNGMRGELRTVAQTVQRHSKLLARLAHEDKEEPSV